MKSHHTAYYIRYPRVSLSLITLGKPPPVFISQPLHSEISSALTLLGDGGGEPLMEPLGNPVEELREAVEMLNDTVRERGRSQNHIHDQAIQTMIRQVGWPRRVDRFWYCEGPVESVLVSYLVYSIHGNMVVVEEQ